MQGMMRGTTGIQSEWELIHKLDCAKTADIAAFSHVLLC
jgi:hypothetical protein